MGNIITQNHGKVSAIDSQTLDEINGRLDTAENAITGADNRIASLEGDMGSVSEQMSRLQLLVAATNASFGEFISGYYNLADNTSGISTVNVSGEWMCSAVSCEEGDKVYINASGPSQSGTYAFIGENGLRIGDVHTGAVNNAEVTAPEGAEAILVNCNINFSNKYVSRGSYNEELDGRIQDLIKYQETQPVESSNKIWFKTADPQRQYTVYTKAEVDSLLANLQPGSGESSSDLTPEERQKIMDLGTASSKNAVTSVGSDPSDNNVPTESALVSYTTGKINELGTAAKKGAATSINNAVNNDTVPTSKAAKDYVDSKVGSVEDRVVSEVDSETPGTSIVNAAAMRDYVQDAITGASIPSSISQTVTTEIPASPDNTTIPTSKAVADHVSEAMSGLGAASTKGFDLSSVSTSISKVPSSNAVRMYVAGEINNLSSTVDTNTSMIQRNASDILAINHNVTNLNQALDSLESDLDYFRDYSVDAVNLNNNNYKIPTSKIVKDYIDDGMYAERSFATGVESRTNKKFETAAGVKYAQFIPGYYPLETSSRINVMLPESDSNAKCAHLVCKAGDVIHFSALGYSTHGVYRIVRMNGDIVEGSGSIAENGRIVVPDTYEGNHYVVVNTTASDQNAMLCTGKYISDIENRIDATETKAGFAAFHVNRIDREIAHDEIWQIYSSGAIINDQWDDTTSNQYHMIFKVKSGDVVTIVPNGENGTEYAFLEDYDHISGDVPAYAESMYETGLQLIEAGSDAENLTTLQDGYIYVAAYHSGNSYDPQSILINGYDMSTGIHEKINELMSMSLGMGGVHGNLGQTDWIMQAGDLTITKKGSNISVRGYYTGEQDLYVKITGTPRYSYGSYDYSQSEYGTAVEAVGTEHWEDHITGTCIQLQASCNGIPYNASCEIDDDPEVKYPDSFSSYDPVRFECYNYDCDSSTVASVIPVYEKSVSYTDTAVSSNSAYGVRSNTGMNMDGTRICAGNIDGYSYFVKPQGIVMRIKSGTTFNEGVEGYEWPGSQVRYTVYVENMDDEYSLSGSIYGLRRTVSTAQQNIERLSQQIQRTATSSANGLMSSADKSKLDAFYGADMYLLKTDPGYILKFNGEVAALSGLPNDADTGDAYYVTAENGVYIYNGTTWDPFGPNVYIETLTNSFIDNLFM